MQNYRDEDMDRWITGNYGQDQFKDECEECDNKEEGICGDCGEHCEICSECGSECCGARGRFEKEYESNEER